MSKISKIVLNDLTHAQRVRHLYKTVLRLHRGLPPEMQDLGDKYTREEFRRHMKCKPNEAELFMTEWAKYVVTISKQLGLRGKAQDTFGTELDTEDIQLLSDDQAVQLYELMLAAKGLEGDTITPEDIQGTKKS